jgi:hypothetical protein
MWRVAIIGRPWRDPDAAASSRMDEHAAKAFGHHPG